MNLSDLKQFGIDTEYPYKTKYGNYIGGKWVEPASGDYFQNISPVNGQVFCEVARSSADDIDRAVDAAHAAKRAWAQTSPADRSNLLLKMADRIEQNLKLLAVAETIDNGKPLRETMAADLPLAAHRPLQGQRRSQLGRQLQLQPLTRAGPPARRHEPAGNP